MSARLCLSAGKRGGVELARGKKVAGEEWWGGGKACEGGGEAVREYKEGREGGGRE